MSRRYLANIAEYASAVVRDVVPELALAAVAEHRIWPTFAGAVTEHRLLPACGKTLPTQLRECGAMMRSIPSTAHQRRYARTGILPNRRV